MPKKTAKTFFQNVKEYLPTCKSLSFETQETVFHKSTNKLLDRKQEIHRKNNVKEAVLFFYFNKKNKQFHFNILCPFYKIKRQNDNAKKRHKPDEYNTHKPPIRKPKTHHNAKNSNI